MSTDVLLCPSVLARWSSLDWLAETDWWEVFAGLVVGVAVYLVTDANRRPNLHFQPQTDAIAAAQPHTDNRPFRRVHVIVENTRRLWFLRWMDRSGNYARCYLHFKDPATGETILSIDGRWASGKEPIDYIAKELDYPAIIMPQREVLVVGESFGVDIAIKFEGDTHFDAVNNRSYLPSDDGPTAWSHRDKRLDQDHLLVQVEIRAEGHRRHSPDFVIRNPNQSLTAFELADG